MCKTRSFKEWNFSTERLSSVIGRESKVLRTILIETGPWKDWNIFFKKRSDTSWSEASKKPTMHLEPAESVKTGEKGYP